MKVLFCTDGSSKSFNAIDNFSKWFNNFEADIVSVSDMTYFTDEILVSNGQILEKCSNNVNNILKFSQEFLDSKGIITLGNIYEDNFTAYLGSLFHYVLEKSLEEVFLNE